MLELPSTTNERVAVPITTTGDPTGNPPEFALTSTKDSTGAQWEAGTWDPNSSWDPNTGQIWALTARMGENQALDVTAEGDYWLHSRWTIDDEDPEDQTDRIRFT